MASLISYIILLILGTLIASKSGLTAYLTLIVSLSTYYLYQIANKDYGYSIIKTNNFIYFFGCRTSDGYYCKFNLAGNKFEAFTTWKDYVASLGVSYFQGSNAVYDGERYIYIIGGGYSGITYNNIIKYDTINDTFEMLEQKLLKGKKFPLVELIDNRVYMFGGQESGTSYGRPNQIDYFDLQYTLPQNNAIIITNTINTDNALPLINTEKLKLNSNIPSAYLGNADNLAEKVNVYYYESHISNDTYSSVTFDKNTIISNFENITNAINNNGGALVCSFGGDSENANYTLMISTSDEGIAVIVMKVNENVMIGNIGSDGTFNESFGATPCTWLEGDTNTTTFDNSYELNTVIDGGLPLSTPQELIDLGICTFEINKGEVVGYWKGINCEDYVEE